MSQGLIKKFFFSKVFVVLGFGVLALLGFGIAKNFFQKQQINSEVAALQQEIANLEQGNNELSSLIDYLQTSNFLEAQAKNKFGLAREGELVLVIPSPDKDKIKAMREGEIAGEYAFGSDLPNPKRWWYYFWNK